MFAYKIPISLFLCPDVHTRGRRSSVIYGDRISDVTRINLFSRVNTQSVYLYTYIYSSFSGQNDVIGFLASWRCGFNGHVSCLTRHWSYVHPVNPEKNQGEKTAYWHGMVCYSRGGDQLRKEAKKKCSAISSADTFEEYSKTWSTMQRPSARDV